MARSKDTISLISADGLRFVIEKKAAMASTTLKRLIIRFFMFTFAFMSTNQRAYHVVSSTNNNVSLEVV